MVIFSEKGEKMEKAPVYIPIVETLKELEDRGWTNDKTGKKIRKEVIRKVILSEGLDESDHEAVGFACNDLVEKGYITSSTEDFKLLRNKLNEIYEKYQ